MALYRCSEAGPGWNNWGFLMADEHPGNSARQIATRRNGDARCKLALTFKEGNVANRSVSKLAAGKSRRDCRRRRQSALIAVGPKNSRRKQRLRSPGSADAGAAPCCYAHVMTGGSYILASLRHYRRIHAAVAAGVAVAAAVITGALLVGDSVRGSLRDLAQAGLGRIDEALVAEQPFAEKLVDRAESSPSISHAAPMLTAPGSLATAGGEVRRASRLTVYGVTPEFWNLASPDRPVVLKAGGLHAADNDLVVSAEVAAELGVNVGEWVLLRLPLAGSIPADSTLGEKEEATASRRLRIAGILADGEAASLGRFSLHPAQMAPRNAFLAFGTMQELLKLPGKANLAVIEQTAESRLNGDVDKAMQFSPTLADFGLKVESVEVHSPAVKSLLQVSANRLVLPPYVAEATQRIVGAARVQPAITYLANAIVLGEKRIPYSTVVGVDSLPIIGPLLDGVGKPLVLAEDEVVLNDWAANELGAKVGDEITLTYYDPETTHGDLRERAPLKLKLRAIAPLADAEGKPSLVADPAFAPELPGVTDEASIADWKLPFELVEKVRNQDETYWDDHRTTPKAFVSYALARRLWNTRWGTDSVLRIEPTPGDDADPDTEAQSLSRKIETVLDPNELGMRVLPVRQQAMAASSGTTPFDGLFLGFSFFLLASSVMMTALLFRLGVEGRARETGLLSSVGISARRLRRLILAEGAVVAAIGAAIGTACGVAYARLMVHGLNTWWVEATSTPFVRLHVTPHSLAIGFVTGLLTALAAIRWSLRSLLRLPPRQLLAGDAEPPITARSAAKWSRTWLPALCLLAALGLGFGALKLQGEAQAGAFFGSGALALLGFLAAVRGKLCGLDASTVSSMTLNTLAARNVRRHPGRTMLALALAATASFLIVVLSAFRLAPTDRGTGGFDLLGYADLPIHYDLGSDAGRQQLGFSAAASKALSDEIFVPFRVRDGEDASCLNLYQTTQPRILGAPPELAELDRFAWASVASAAGDKSPWSLLLEDLPQNDSGIPVVPMVLDRNTAFYSLKLYAVGDRLPIRDSAGRQVELEVVAMLANSVLQGDVVISRKSFLSLFPETAGERFFLIRRGAQSPPLEKLSAELETQLEDFGFDAVPSQTRLADLMAVQNTYLSTFQSLGALGLLLGAAGLAVVQLRSVVERRSELALMQAAGWPRGRLRRMVLAENLGLLLAGLAIGCAAALVAVVPHAWIEQVGTPWRTLAVLLALVALVGAAAAYWASSAVLKAPLVAALRGE